MVHSPKTTPTTSCCVAAQNSSQGSQKQATISISDITQLPAQIPRKFQKLPGHYSGIRIMTKPNKTNRDQDANINTASCRTTLPRKLRRHSANSPPRIMYSRSCGLDINTTCAIYAPSPHHKGPSFTIALQPNTTPIALPLPPSLLIAPGSA